MTGEIRIHKILSRAGLCSLREAERLVAEGRVTVNGAIVSGKGASADPDKDRIVVDGKKVGSKAPHVYMMMNKPKGYVTTRSDEKGRKTVMDLLPPGYQHLYPVGRLDMMSEGLLLFTNDGDFTQALMAPKKEVERVYKVKYRNPIDDKTMKKMISGITVDNEKLKVKSIRVEVKATGAHRAKVILTEGKNRHIRRLFETLGHPVQKLKRIAVGPVTIGDLKPGELKHIPVELVNKVKKSSGHGFTRTKRDTSGKKE